MNLTLSENGIRNFTKEFIDVDAEIDINLENKTRAVLKIYFNDDLTVC